MKKIALIEYIGQENRQGQLIGHGIKVIQDNNRLLTGLMDTVIICTKNIDNFASDIKSVALPYNIIISEDKSIYKSIKDYIYKHRNIKCVFKEKDIDYYWFCNIDFSLLFFLYFHKKYCSKVILTLYRKDFGGKGIIKYFKQSIINHVFSKVKLIINTNKSFVIEEGHQIYIPDYYYDKSKYDKYVKEDKDEIVVCLGTMNKMKRIEELIEIFNTLDYPLKIVGRFFDSEWKKELQSKANSNIEILDTYLSEDDYLNMLASAKYCAIPYQRSMYNYRTSGVLQESIFLRTAPISYSWFLEQNGTNGIYLEDLLNNNSSLEKFDYRGFREWCNVLIEDEYNMEKIKKKIVEAICC